MTERVKTAAPVSETGYVQAAGMIDGWTAWDPFEKTPELQWPQSVSVYSRMDNEDSRVTSLLEAISLPIRSTPWRIKPNGARDEVVQFISRNLMVPIDGEDEVQDPGRSRGRFSWEEHLEEVCSPTLQYGHALFEQVYRPRSQSPDGRFWLRKLAPRPQWTILKFNVALDGGLESIEQVAPPARTAGSLYVANITPPEIPVNRLVVYTRNKRPGQWQGKSILRSAYKHWLLKDKLLRIEAATAERNGMGIPVGTAANANDQDEVKKMAALARSVRGGLNAGVGLANGQILELLGVSGNLPDIRRAIDGHDRSIALSGLAHFLNLDGKGGSYALASVLEDPFTQAVHAYAKSICRIANQHIIEDLIDLNFGVDESAPLLVFDPIGSRQDLTAAAVKLLFDAGVFDDDPAVKRAIRQRFNLPSELNDSPPQEEPPTVPTQSAQPARTRSSGSASARARRVPVAAGQGALFDA
ncbi:phage portal protein family protein [Mycolicibacterium psychrotolerans]|uniref:phage portal protein family protein n=1 Tax=Mycolicibacterium psychrotolerans TaxID=216929 RepID=UPI003D66A2D9